MKRAAFALVALALTPQAIAARGLDPQWYAGGGWQYGWVASGNPSIDGAEGPGFEVVLGRRIGEHRPMFFDLRAGGIFVDVGPTPEIFYPAGRADYGILALGVTFAGPGSGESVRGFRSMARITTSHGTSSSTVSTASDSRRRRGF